MTGEIAPQAHIFISYSHADAQLANALAQELRSRGAGIWIDTEELRLGDSQHAPMLSPPAAKGSEQGRFRQERSQLVAKPGTIWYFARARETEIVGATARRYSADRILEPFTSGPA